MRTLTGANSFFLHHLNAVEYNVRQGKTAFDNLIDAACLEATHQSEERFVPPKCHPEMRMAIVSEIMDWVNMKDPSERIKWLNGPAGAGKSSIAQTIGEIYHKKNRLIASFFFSRAATGTRSGSSLIPTIAYQLALSIPATRDIIISQLDRDIAILDRSMERQMQKLIVEPLKQVAAQLGCAKSSNPHLVADSQSDAALHRGESNAAPLAELVIIDGLDECNDLNMQSNIIRVIARILSQSPVHLRLRFLISSRREPVIQMAFNSITPYEQPDTLYTFVLSNAILNGDLDPLGGHRAFNGTHTEKGGAPDFPVDSFPPILTTPPKNLGPFAGAQNFIINGAYFVDNPQLYVPPSGYIVLGGLAGVVIGSGLQKPNNVINSNTRVSVEITSNGVNNRNEEQKLILDIPSDRHSEMRIDLGGNTIVSLSFDPSKEEQYNQPHPVVTTQENPKHNELLFSSMHVQRAQPKYYASSGSSYVVSAMPSRLEEIHVIGPPSWSILYCARRRRHTTSALLAALWGFTFTTAFIKDNIFFM